MKILFEKLANFVRKDEYAKISIPFKKGDLFDENLVSIIDINGKELVTQPEILTKYDDGSIKWLLIHFFATLNANDKTLCEAVVGQKRTEFKKMEIDKSLEKLVPLNLFFNINSTDYTIELDFSQIKDYEIVRTGAVITEIVHRKTINISSTKTVEFVFDIQLFENKDFTKLDIKITNLNEDDLDISDTYVLYKSDTNINEKYIAYSNYKTVYLENEEKVIYNKIDGNRILNTSNEHYPETFYGAFYGVVREENKGVCITIKEAFQNYPKAFNVDQNCISAYIIPEDDVIKFNSGVSKTHTLFIHKFDNNIDREELNQIHHQFQMPDLAILDSEVYKEVGFIEDLFTENKDKNIEGFFVSLADSKGYSYGMMNFGDVYDKGYTDQGRGGQHLVFSNNEYDYPFFAYLFFMRNGTRRFYDYFNVAVRHMMDVDICHFSKDEFRQDGLIEHSKEHTTGVVTLSHEWLRGLIEYYHATGDVFAKDAFLKMGENILRNLQRPEFSVGFSVNVRETGWALNALVALFEETNDKKYMDACDKIVEHFFDWEKKYGALLAPYTNHTTIRVPFMISVACNSLYAYYRVTKDERVKNLIIRATDDLIENSLLESGFFYYKELPSLQRNSTNPIILETLAICYSFTNDKKYLDAGVKTFKTLTAMTFPLGNKILKDNIVIVQGQGTKFFAQSFYPLIKFYKFLNDSDYNN